MQTQRARARTRLITVSVIVLLIAIVLAAAFLLTGTADDEGDTTPVTLFLSFVPSVQFAPAYVAAERGYFADEAIDITFEQSLNEADGVERIANNDLQFGIISGEQVLLARARQRPIVYAFEWYHRFPVGIVSAAELDITEPADLAGRVVGVPGTYGANYIGLRALLAAADLQESDLGELRSIGFAAAENICEEQVEAAVIYVANEPLTIERQCTPVNLIRVSDYATLVSNGLVTNEQTIRDNPDLVRGMARALRRGIQDVIADPDAAFDISVQNYVTDLPDDQYDIQRQVLLNSIELWRSDDLGRTNPAAWEDTQAILIAAGLMNEPLDDLAACYTTEFLPE